MSTNWQIGDFLPDQGDDRWEIQKILEGGMGIIYVVYDQEWQLVFAAKTFRDEIFIRNPQIANRFKQEALAWINLDKHLNIVQARFLEPIEGKLYLFLEYAWGGDIDGLRTGIGRIYMKKKGYPTSDLGSRIGTPYLTEDMPQVLRLAIQFCDGMTHALSKGIKAHRDIKPKNCLITADNVLKVTDFGLAKVVAMHEGGGGRAGTPML